MITTVCYGKEEKWESREKAMEEFFLGMVACDGCEAERYAKVYTELAMGLNHCTDDPEMFGGHKMTGNDLEAMRMQFA